MQAVFDAMSTFSDNARRCLQGPGRVETGRLSSGRIAEYQARFIFLKKYSNLTLRFPHEFQSENVDRASHDLLRSTVILSAAKNLLLTEAARSKADSSLRSE